MAFTPRESGALRAAGVTKMAGATQRNGKMNPLLLRDDIGKARATSYDLPTEGFSYGRPGNQDLEGAREVSMRWVAHTPSRAPEETSPDFVKFNKKAADNKITSAREARGFRDTQNMNSSASPKVAPQSARLPSRKLVPSDVVPGFTYGASVRPSTPIQDVISNRFADKAEKDLNSFYDEFHRMQEVEQTHVRKIPLTTASRGHGTAAKKAVEQQAEPKELFKLSKFKRVQAKVETSHRKIRSDFDDNGVELDLDCGR